MDKVNARAVVSKATLKPDSKPSIASFGELTRASGDKSPRAKVIPITVPRNPSMGVAQMMMRTKA